jgi:hypothetical protein
MFQDALAAVRRRPPSGLPDRRMARLGRRSRGPGHALCLRRRQTPARVSGAGNRGALRRRPTGRSMPPPPSNACMPTASSMTTCPAWMTTTCAAAEPTVHRKWDEATAVLSATRFRPSPSSFWPTPPPGMPTSAWPIWCEPRPGQRRAGHGSGPGAGHRRRNRRAPADPGRDHRASGQQDRPPDRMAGEAGAILGRADPGAAGPMPRHRPRLPDRRRHPRRHRRQRPRRARRCARMPRRARRPSSRCSASTAPDRAADALVEEACAALAPYGDRSQTCRRSRATLSPATSEGRGNARKPAMSQRPADPPSRQGDLTRGPEASVGCGA